MYRVLFLLLLPSVTLADHWPAWRGPHNTGVSDEYYPPLRWGPEKNIAWKVPLPEPGNSTPIVWGDHVFLTQALDGGKRRALIAFNRADGKKLWQKEVPCDVQETTHKQNPPCSASAVADGKAVYAHFASAGVIAFDFEGKELWRRDLGPLLHKWGNGASPILYKDLLIVVHGPGEPTFLIALDKRNGNTVWKKEETAINSPIFGSWSTPIILRDVAQDADPVEKKEREPRDELIMPLPGDKIGGEGYFKAYDPATGNELWRCYGLGNEIYAMPIVGPKSNIIVGISGHNGPLLAVQAGGKGDVTKTHRLWQQAGKNPQRIGSGIIRENRLYIADAPGFVECVSLKTGEARWKERVDGNLWGSIVLAHDRLYVTSLEGTTYVLSAWGAFEVLATNELKEPIYAAPAIAGGQLFLRTYQHLYCIGKK